MNTSFIITLFLTYSAFAFEITAQPASTNVNLQVSGIELPENIKSKSLKSGFTNTIVIQLFLWKGGKVVAKKELTSKIVYDLWDEKFSIKRTVEGHTTNEKARSEDDVLEKLKKYTFVEVISKKELADNPSIEVSARIIADPITKEKQQKIKTWLAENQVNLPSPSGPSQTRPGGSTTVRDPSASGSTIETVKRSVFNQVLDSELNDNIVDGAWTFESEKFKLGGKDSKNAK